MAKKEKLPPAVAKFFRDAGKRGGLLGREARMEKITPERRSAIAKKAAAARWGKKAAKKIAAKKAVGRKGKA